MRYSVCLYPPSRALTVRYHSGRGQRETWSKRDLVNWRKGKLRAAKSGLTKRTWFGFPQTRVYTICAPPPHPIPTNLPTPTPISRPPLPILPNHPRPLLRNRIHRRLDMRAHLQRHHARIAHPQAPGPIHPQPRIHDPVLDPGAPAHRAGAHGVPVRDRVGADKGGEIFVVFGCLVGGGGGGGAGGGSGVDG